jgi:Icc-related predicted phosphoesterase
MKCLLVSDLHYTLKQFDWLNSVADRFDCLVIAGDMLDISSTVPVNAQILIVLKYLRMLSQHTRVLVCSGNHDLNALNAAGEKTAGWMQRVRRIAVPCDEDRVDIGATTLSICPWWDGPAARQRIGDQLARDATQRAEHWVWVYHAPPDQSPVSWAGKQHFGDSYLRDWINRYQPDMVLTGHIHQSPFKPDGSWVDRIGATWVFNPGRQIGPVPTQVIIDTDKGEAIWLSLAGAQRVGLAEPLQRPVEELA